MTISEASIHEAVQAAFDASYADRAMCEQIVRAAYKVFARSQAIHELVQMGEPSDAQVERHAIHVYHSLGWPDWETEGERIKAGYRRSSRAALRAAGGA